MGLAVLTPKGKVHEQDQYDATDIVASRSNFKFKHSYRKDSPVDAIILENDMVVGICEVKTRPDLTMSHLFRQFKNQWLITASKLGFLQCGGICFGCSGYGLLYLKSEALVMMVKLYDEAGALHCDVKYDETETQATCNGGTAIRLNAFIDMRTATIYKR